jgi:hypothetical protein
MSVDHRQPEPNVDSAGSDPTASLMKAIRFAFFAILLGLSYFCYRGAVFLDSFDHMVPGLIGNHPWPSSTLWAFQTRKALVVLACVVPFVGFGALYLRRPIAAIYLLGGLIGLSVVQIGFTWHAMAALLELFAWGFAAPVEMIGR